MMHSKSQPITCGRTVSTPFFWYTIGPLAHQYQWLDLRNQKVILHTKSLVPSRMSMAQQIDLADVSQPSHRDGYSYIH
jgi:hypothetical protein